MSMQRIIHNNLNRKKQTNTWQIKRLKLYKDIRKHLGKYSTVDSRRRQTHPYLEILLLDDSLSNYGKVILSFEKIASLAAKYGIMVLIHFNHIYQLKYQLLGNHVCRYCTLQMYLSDGCPLSE